MSKFINIENMDREEAILIYKNKIYVNSNHQFAFKEALEDEGLSLGLDIDTDIDEIAKITHNLSEENKICTLDLYIDNLENKYLISHFKENLMINLDLLKIYCSKHKYILGYFINFENEDCCLL